MMGDNDLKQRYQTGTFDNNRQYINRHQSNGVSFLPSTTPCNTIVDYSDTNSEHLYHKNMVIGPKSFKNRVKPYQILRQNIYDDPLIRTKPY